MLLRFFIKTYQAFRRIGHLAGVDCIRCVKEYTGAEEGSDCKRKYRIAYQDDIPERIDSLKARKTPSHFQKGVGCSSIMAAGPNLGLFLPLYIKYMIFPESPSYYSYRYMQENYIGSDDLIMLDEINRRDIIKRSLTILYKMEELIKLEANLMFLEEDIPQNPYTVEVMGMKIGDILLITFPGEVLENPGRFGPNIKNRSPYDTFACGCTNGFITGDYAPASDAYDGGGEAYVVQLAGDI